MRRDDGVEDGGAMSIDQRDSNKGGCDFELPF
jgi:hypothetical protein